jgi:hypothetical protein
LASGLTIPLDNIKTRLQTQTCFNEDCLFNEECSVYKTNNLINAELKSVQDGKPKSAAKKLTDFVSKSFANKKNSCAIIEPSPVKYQNAITASKTIFKEEGLRGFTKGVFPRILAQAPSSAISWASYEMIKRLLVRHNILDH